MPLKGTDSISIMGWYRDLNYNEVHLLIMGLYSGFMAIRPKPRLQPKEPPEGDKRRLNWDYNKWYWQGGYIMGYLLKVAAGIAYFSTGAGLF